MWKRIALVALAIGGTAGCGEAPVVPDAPASAAASEVPVGPIVEVKFREELGVRADGAGGVRGTRGRSVAALQAAMPRMGVRHARALFEMPAGRLEGLERAARARSKRPIPDLGSWHRLTLAPGADAASAAEALRALPEVEHAYPAPRPARPPSTPDFAWRQTYFFAAAPTGSDMTYAHTLPGGRGAGVTVVDMEYNWTFYHEDVDVAHWQLISGNLYHLPPDPFWQLILGNVAPFEENHGTAVVGMLTGKENDFGVTGGVPDAALRLATPFVIFYLPALSIANVGAQMYPGDVLLLELQDTIAPGYVPLEWIPSVYDAIRLVTQAGIVVVEAGANGGLNLDASMFGGRFDRALYDSGAILVGAGNLQHARFSFSSYGSRLDVQGLGGGVTTTGYGDLSGTGPLNRYTGSFDGTSSASPIVAAAAVSIQGYLKATGRSVLTPPQMRDLLSSTGTPQTGNTSEKIGPYPDLRVAVALLDQQHPLPPP